MYRYCLLDKRYISSSRGPFGLGSTFLLCSRYSRNSKAEHSTARYSRCVVSCLLSDSIKRRIQYPTDIVVSPSCFWSGTNPTCTLHASEAQSINPVLFSTPWTGRKTSAFLRDSMHLNYFSLKVLNVISHISLNWSLKGAKCWVELRAKHPKT